MTIVEAVRKILNECNNVPLSIPEIYKIINKKKYYHFIAESPLNVLRLSIRRSCLGVEISKTSKIKYFGITEDKKYFLIDNPIDMTKEKKVIENSSKYSIKDLLKYHKKYENKIKNNLLCDLKSLNPFLFEIFSKKLLEGYGFVEVTVTSKTKDGGIDGFGKLSVGISYLNVAFQSKRWSKGKVTRPEIDKFRGAIQGDFEQGILFTTSKFTQGAKSISLKKGAVPIVLIDGSAIIDIMIGKKIGVQINNLPIYQNNIDILIEE